nr:hypothetical protein [uncultured Methanobrevibacter sp.]
MSDKKERFLKQIQLKNKQRAIEKQYAKEGLSDEILDAQIKLNQLRHELDIPDESNFIFENFVQ